MLRSRRIRLTALLLALGLVFYAFWVEPRRLVVTEYRLPVQGLSEDIRMVVIADPQPSGPHWPAERVRDAMSRAAALKGDIVLLLGDYVSTVGLSTSFTEPADTIAAMGQLGAPMGVYAILGNHDWNWDASRIRGLLAAQGIVVLEDRAVLARAGDKALWIAGLNDTASRRFDLAGTLAQTDETAPTILLSHSPDVFPDVPAQVDLTLAGHTHGGQVYIPGLGRPIVPSAYGDRYAYGHIVEYDQHLIVSGGIGTAILPIRFLTPPELVVVTLTPGEEPQQSQ